MENNKSYNLLLRGWFKTKGRSRRQEYIQRFVFFWVVIYTTSFLFDFTGNLNDTEPNITYLFFAVLSCFMSFLSFLSLVQVFFVTHRRLHDLNASGWWQLITFIPFGQILMIGFIFFKGTKGTNKYGPPPEY